MHQLTHFVHSIGGWLVAVPLCVALIVLGTLAALTAWASGVDDSHGKQEMALHIKMLARKNGKKVA